MEKVLLFSLDEAKQKLSQSNEVVPFTALAVKENLFIENHPGESVEACFNAARHTVQHAQGAQAYALCYDGYVEVDEGTKDALIAEGVCPAQIRASLWLSVRMRRGRHRRVRGRAGVYRRGPELHDCPEGPGRVQRR